MCHSASNECASCEKVCLRPINECSLVITCATCKTTCNVYNDENEYLQYTYINISTTKTIYV